MAEESWNRGADETGCQAPENHRLCANNCGFFGSPTTMNLCSKCYRDLRMKELQESSAKPPIEKSLTLMEQSSATVEIREEKTLIQPAVPFLPSSSSVPRASSTPVSGKPNRCSSCNKRVGLMGFKCRCGSTFCASHRLPEKHVCSFDFKAAGREAIARSNPVVKAEKLEKI
ncbi:zinc finger A20 and AN1 domain-containing stress-associated protein 4 [Nymphaea colorata]|uniref:AN1-type domain-containing protein n=1 Tax=Nymphaea colorata TaxID=210225 RepID=A0A5K0WSP7_9MAGN|nr:zinc finger A20 and AN1 domain-containing stress-associated protein 4 [Nymphaea colorata]